MVACDLIYVQLQSCDVMYVGLASCLVLCCDELQWCVVMFGALQCRTEIHRGQPIREW